MDAGGAEATEQEDRLGIATPLRPNATAEHRRSHFRPALAVPPHRSHD